MGKKEVVSNGHTLIKGTNICEVGAFLISKVSTFNMTWFDLVIFHSSRILELTNP